MIAWGIDHHGDDKVSSDLCSCPEVYGQGSNCGELYSFSPCHPERERRISCLRQAAMRSLRLRSGQAFARPGRRLIYGLNCSARGTSREGWATIR